MEKEFIPYEQALEIKELGFNQPCFGYYTGDKKHLQLRPNMGRMNEPSDDVPTAPTFSQVFRWFREVYNIYVEISFNQKYENSKFGYIIRTKSSCLHTRDFPYKTYEEAELKCLKRLIEIVKEK